MDWRDMWENATGAAVSMPTFRSYGHVLKSPARRAVADWLGRQPVQWQVEPLKLAIVSHDRLLNIRQLLRMNPF